MNWNARTFPARMRRCAAASALPWLLTCACFDPCGADELGDERCDDFVLETCDGEVYRLTDCFEAVCEPLGFREAVCEELSNTEAECLCA